ncbi:glycoside hydrolase family 3 N-terminal domain-containing protein [Corynebacterium liangguodongii]|uniref:glycoside hydrolase family 3 N-terminal domain-containing protein n=1 Tax=Corynebacterium liangguodongii TaxID=2079535 RepID=UPI001F2448C6|nr:glycoside hydrolase family 3 N-terminal domain-containing protein [Corynebacterium liangguodongii]
MFGKNARPAVAAGLLVCPLAAVGCAGVAEGPEVATSTLTVTRTHTTTAPPPVPPAPSAADRVPEDLRQKVASLMVVGVSNYDQARFALDQGVGGLIIPSWADPALLTEEGRNINALRAEYGRPFSVAVDFEGGRVQRHTQVFGEWMPPRGLAHQPDGVIRGTGYDIGRSLRAHGVNVDYAPLLDLDVASLDIVGDRSFGTDPGEVARVAGLFAQGLVDAGVTPTFKHFPGHGRASGDTHLALAVTPVLADLEALDMLPYATVLRRHPGASVMMGHVIVPGLGGGDVPSSLNPEAYRILREGDYPGGVPFDGVIVTDDLSGMRGITDYRPTPDAVRDAIASGADQALWSSGADIPLIIDGVTAAVLAGAIPAERIDAAAERTQRQLIAVGL